MLRKFARYSFFKKISGSIIIPAKGKTDEMLKISSKEEITENNIRK